MAQMNMNPIQQMMQMVKTHQNPSQMMLEFLQQQNNPMSQNLLSLARANNTQDIEKIARNIFSQRGLDFDKEFTAFKQSLGIK